jgi:hypothetical protein
VVIKSYNQVDWRLGWRCDEAFFHQIHLLLTQLQKFIGCIKGGPAQQFDTSDDLEEAAKLTSIGLGQAVRHI